MAAFLLLLLPGLAMARIDVEISGKFDGTEKSKMEVYFAGSEAGVISDHERLTFGLSDSTLKDGIRSYFGKKPDHAYLRSPTPWGDLYESFGWSQVKRTLVPKSGRILKITSEPQILLEKVFENNSTEPAVFNVGIRKAVENQASWSWAKGGDLSVDQEIRYSFDIKMKNARRSTWKSFTSPWGENTEKSETVTVGASSPMELMLQPGQSVWAQLQAMKATIRVEMEYEASLSGAAAVSYDDMYKGHHFWGLDVQAVMNAAGLSNHVRSKQIIDIVFYSNPRVMVHDRKMNQKIMEVEF